MPFFAALEVAVQIRADAYRVARLTRRPVPERAATVGEWGRLMRRVGLAATLPNAAFAVYSARALLDRSSNERLLCFLAFSHGLAALYVAYGFLSPDAPPGYRDLVSRHRFVVGRHVDPTFYDDDADDRDDGIARGNVDRVGVVERPRGKPLGPRDAERLAHLEGRRAAALIDLKTTRAKYERARATEAYSPACGVGYSKRTPDLALGMITVTVLEVHDVGTRDAPVDPRRVRVVVGVKDLRHVRVADREYAGAVGPGPQISQPAKGSGRDDARGRDATNGAPLVFGQVFSVAPVKSKAACLVIDITDASKKKRLASVSYPLRDLASQRTESLTLSMTRDGARADVADAPRPIAYVKAKFQYSKVLPIKHRVYAILDYERRLRRDITNLRQHKALEFAWDFPGDDFAAGAPPAGAALV